MNSTAQIEVNLELLTSNIKKLFKKYSDYQYKIVDMRDNFFGLGIYTINTFMKEGIDYVLTSSLKEAINIRRYNEEVKILIKKEVDLEYVYDAINGNFALSIYSVDYLKSLIDLNLRDKLYVHILIDNNAIHQGIKSKEELKEILDLIEEQEKIVVEGIYSDVTSYGVDDSYYYEQMRMFLDIIADVDKEKYIIHLNEPVMYHKKNDVVNGLRFDLSLLGMKEYYHDSFVNNMRRKKIANIYGDEAFRDLKLDLDLIFSITANVVSIKNVSKGTLIGKSYVASEDMKIGIIDIGYKDGLTKAIKEIVINDLVCDVLADEIDTLYVKVDDSVEVYDKAFLISNYNYIDNVLKNLNTNRYYLMSIINSNIKRVYEDEESIEEVEY